MSLQEREIYYLKNDISIWKERLAREQRINGELREKIEILEGVIEHSKDKRPF